MPASGCTDGAGADALSTCALALSAGGKRNRRVPCMPATGPVRGASRSCSSGGSSNQGWTATAGRIAALSSRYCSSCCLQTQIPAAAAAPLTTRTASAVHTCRFVDARDLRLQRTQSPSASATRPCSTQRSPLFTSSSVSDCGAHVTREIASLVGSGCALSTCSWRAEASPRSPVGQQASRSSRAACRAVTSHPRNDGLRPHIALQSSGTAPASCA